MLTMVADKAMG